MTQLTLYSEAKIPTLDGDFQLLVFHDAAGAETVAMVSGDVRGAAHVPVRVHSACFTSEVMGSLKCDCREQLQFALKYITGQGGVVIYLNQEGRGIGLGNKIAAYALQERGLDTVDANLALGLPQDARTYENAAQVIQHMGIQSVRLMTNNPSKIQALEELGIDVSGRLSVEIDGNHHSNGYLSAKQQRMGHMISQQSEHHPGRSHPFVHLNFAIDQNGVAGSGQISCAEDWRRVHQLRERYTVIAVGGITWNADRPRLTARKDLLGYEPQRQPHRVVFAGSHKCVIPNDGRPSFVVGEQQSLHCQHIRSSGRRLNDPLKSLFQGGVDSMLVEGGRTLHKSFLQQGLVDKLTIYVRTQSDALAMEAAGDLLSGQDGLSFKRFGEGMLLSKVFENRGASAAASSTFVRP